MDILSFFDDGVEKSRANVLANALELQKEELAPPKSKLDLFRDLMPSLLTTKKYLFEHDKDYVPFMVNRLMSYNDDSIFYAQELNQRHQLPKRMQYDFYFHSLRGKKRPRSLMIWLQSKHILDTQMPRLFRH